MGLIDLIRGLFPGTSTTKEDLVTLNDMRLKKYRRNWISYYGIDLERMVQEDGSAPNKVNFLKRNIDKINYFAFGNGYEATHPRLQDQLDLANTCWGNKKIEKLLRIAQQGSATGDAFIMVAPRDVTNKLVTTEAVESDKVETPSAKIRIVSIPSEYCTPTYDPFDSDILLSMEIRVPFQTKGPDGGYTTHYQYMKITSETVQTGIVDGDNNILGSAPEQNSGVLASVPNPIKSVYCVHVRNFPAGNSIYGCDDIAEVALLNEAYTQRLTEIGAIVNYHSAPITCVFGAKAGNLVRGPNKVWGNLPKDGKVENLELKTDLRAANDHLSKVKEGIHELTGVPEIAQGTQQAISNTSGVALHTMYLPLIERAETKQNIYTPGLIEVIILALRWCFALDLTGLIDPESGEVETVEEITDDSDWEDLRHNTEFNFPSPLPKDKLIEAQVQNTLITAKLQSRKRAMIALGVKDPEVLLAEIAEDDKAAMQRAKDNMVATGMTADGKPITPPATTTSTANAKGDEAIDEGGSGINSGAGATQGNQSTESGAPKGRPKN